MGSPADVSFLSRKLFRILLKERLQGILKIKTELLNKIGHKTGKSASLWEICGKVLSKTVKKTLLFENTIQVHCNFRPMAKCLPAFCLFFFFAFLSSASARPENISAKQIGRAPC